MALTTPPPPITSTDPRLRQLRHVLGRVQMRFRLMEAVRLMPAAAALGVGAATVLAAVWRFQRMLPVEGVLAVGLGLVVAALLTVLAYAMLRPRDPMRTALHADVLLGLDERLSTALEDATRPTAAHMQGLRDAQLDDALLAASRISPRRDLPVAVKREAMWSLAAMLALLAFTVLVPNPGAFGRDANLQAQIDAEKAGVAAVQKAIEAQPNAATDPALKELQRELAGLSKDLSQNDLSREEAVARLSESESKLQKALDPQAPAKRAALDQMAKQLGSSGNQQAKEAGDALKQGDTEKAAKALEKAGQNAAKMSPEERKALAESLKQARDSAASLDPQLAQRLNEAANALESSDPKAAEQAMKNLGQTVQENGQQLATQKQVEQALAQIQQSKTNMAQAGSNGTPSPNGTAQANTNGGGTAQTKGNSTPLSGTAVAFNGTPRAVGTSIAMSGSPMPGTPRAISGTPVALGSPAKGRPAGTGTPGTPVLVPGTPGQGTPVTAQNGQQGQGQGQEQSGQQGQDAQGQGGQQGQGQAQGQGQPGGGAGSGHTEPVYAPSQEVNAALTPVALQGQQNPNGEQSSTTTGTDANNTGPASVPYEQVYGQYREQAGNALNGDYIPQGYKDLVRDYFNGIEPGSPAQP